MLTKFTLENLCKLINIEEKIDLVRVLSRFNEILSKIGV